MFQTPDQAPLGGVGHARQAVRLLRCDRSTAAGRCRASPTCSAARGRAGHASSGGGRACWAAAPITGAASRCATGPTTSSPTAATDWASTGRSRYEDVAPYYDKVEMLIGVYGTQRGPREHAGLARRDACCRRPRRWSAIYLVAQRAKRLGIPVDPGPPRRADAAAGPPAHPGAAASGQSDGAAHPGRGHAATRSACIWATPCGRGCAIRANYQSTTVHLPPALATGNLDILTDAMVARGHARRATAAPTASLHRPDDRRGTSTSRRASSCSRRAPASPCASCSTRSRAQLPGRPRQLERQGRPLPDGHGRRQRRTARSRCSRACRRTTRTARATGTSCTRPGGSTRNSTPASSASRAAITSNSAAASACRRRHRAPGSSG